MPLIDLNHYFVRAKDLERSRRFYCDVLGFEVMPRPDFAFPGYWRARATCRKSSCSRSSSPTRTV